MPKNFYIFAARIALVLSVVVTAACTSDIANEPICESAQENCHSDTAKSSIKSVDFSHKNDAAKDAEILRNAMSRVDTSELTLAQKKLFEILDAQSRFFERLERGSKLKEAEGFSEYKRVRSMWEAYVAENPRDAEALIVYGKFLRRAGDVAGAYAVFSQAEKMRPQNHAVKQQMATYEGEIGMYKESYAHLRDALKLDADNPIYLVQLAQLILVYREKMMNELNLSQKSLDDKLLDCHRRVAQILPEDFEAQTRYAQSFYDVGKADWNAALKQWELVEKMAAFNFERQNAKANRARVLIELDRDAEAAKLLDEVTLPAFETDKLALLGEIARAREAAKNNSKNSDEKNQNTARPQKNTFEY